MGAACCRDNKSVVEGGQPVASTATSARGLDRAALEKLSLAELKAVALQCGVQDPTGHRRRKATYIDPILRAQGVSSSSSSSSSSRPPAKAQQAGSSSSAAAATKKAHGPSGVEETGLALLIGASQDGQNVKGGLAKGGAIEFRTEGRCYVPRSSATRSGSALPDVYKDVQTVKDYIETSLTSVAVQTSFVGKDGTRSLTRKAFHNKVKRLLDERGHKLYLLYYAGHGAAKTGALFLEDGIFTFDELLNLWENREGAVGQRRRAEHFLIIADSCYSGALVQALRALPKTRRNGLNVAVQAACRNDEWSRGGIFTETFTQKQCTPNHKFQWEQLYQTASRGVKCTTCDAFYNSDCRGCRALNRDHGYPRNKEDIQHPTFYATSKETKKQIEVGDYAIRFFERRKSQEN